MSSSMKQRGNSVTTRHSHNEPTVSCAAMHDYMRTTHTRDRYLGGRQLHIGCLLQWSYHWTIRRDDRIGWKDIVHVRTKHIAIHHRREGQNRHLSTETVEGAARALEGVDDIQCRHGFPNGTRGKIHNRRPTHEA